MKELTERVDLAAPEGVPPFRTAVRGYSRPDVDDAVGGLTAQCAFLHRLASDLEDELREMEQLLARKQSSEGRAGAGADECSELTEMIEGILRPAQVDARRIMEEAELSRASACTEAEEAANVVRESAERECVQAESGARARAEQMLSRAREQAERTLAAAAAREAGAAQEAEQLLDDTKRAMVRAAADGEIALKAWCTEKVAEMDSRQADQEKWLGECQRAAAEAEQLSALLTQEAQRKAQEILDAAQEEVTALAEEGARLAEFVEHQAELGCAEIREHMEAIHEGIASLGEQLRERGAYLVSPDASYTAVG